MRTLLIVVFWALFALVSLVVGCSEVRTLEDAGADSAGPPSCGPYVNVIGVSAFRCEWQAWSCSADAARYLDSGCGRFPIAHGSLEARAQCSRCSGGTGWGA